MPANTHHGATPSAADIRRQALYATVAQIPHGKVISYGELAQLAGLGRAARWVGSTLSQLPKDTLLPWHRVVAAQGRLSLSAESPAGQEQRLRLRNEGVLTLNNRIDMHLHRWRSDKHTS